MIRNIHWDTLSSEPITTLTSAPRHLHAIFPSPIDSDQCFHEAGYRDFADTTNVWDDQWNQIVRRAIEYLSRIGQLSIREPIVPVIENRLVDRIFKRVPRFDEQTLTVCEQIVLATMDDQFGQCIVDFGSNRDATLIANAGHPILWVFAKSQFALSIEDMAETIGPTYPNSQRKLDWYILKPPQFPG